jgi:galactokinase
LEFADLNKKKETLLENFSSLKRGGNEVRVIASPYRICPLGAHIDHQGGPVLGMTINACTLMAFSGSDDSLVRLHSRNYPGEVIFDLDQGLNGTGSFWGVYPRAAALALKERYSIKKGITGLLDGMLPGCGLSSSASVLLAYLHALAQVNGLEIAPWEYVRLTRRAEKDHIGLNNGILDQTSIVFGRKGRLLYIDTKNEEVHYLPERIEKEPYRLIVAFSGHSRELTTSGYNSRVDECCEAATKLSERAGKKTVHVLSDVDPSDFQKFRGELDKNLMKRSQHYFTESSRVVTGVDIWSQGSLREFGRLMNESCRSSMEQYECGIQPVHDLQQIVSSTRGVLGSRFMGGGFGGCVVGFVKPELASEAVATIWESYRKLHPEVSDQAAVYLAHSDDGVRFI